MKIYFAGSIRGGREYQGNYERIIAHLNKNHTVLSEHIGLATLSQEGQNKSAEEVFTVDTTWIRECDLVVAEVSTPSLGVGYEIGYAESLGKPILCLHCTKSNKQTSAMIAGNEHLTLISYENVEDAIKKLDTILD